MGCLKLNICAKPELTGILSKNYLTLKKTKKKARRAYRFAFNGQEKDDELKGRGNHNTAEFWQYDTRLGRRWNIDPKPTTGISEYATFANNPIWFSDVKGDIIINKYSDSKDNQIKIDELTNKMLTLESKKEKKSIRKEIDVLKNNLDKYNQVEKLVADFKSRVGGEEFNKVNNLEYEGKEIVLR